MAPKYWPGSLPQDYACFISRAAVNAVERQKNMTSPLLINLAPQKGSAYTHGDLQLILKVTKANRKLYRAYHQMKAKFGDEG